MKARLFLLMLLSSLLASGDADAQQVVLKATLQAPLANPFYGVSLSRLKEEVEKRSRNTLAIEIFDNQKLFRDEETVGAVSSGAVDIGVAASFHYAKRVPAIAILDLPFLFNFPALVRETVSPASEIRRLIDDIILTEMGMRILWWQSLGDTVFFSNGRDIADPERVKGQRVAAPGKPMAELSARCGGRPEILGIEKMMDAFKEGTIDVAAAAMAAIQSRDLWKASDTVTRTAHAPLEFLLAINEKSYQSLSPGHRTILTDAARDVERETRARVADLETKAVAFANSKGMRVVGLTPDHVAEWRACSADAIVDFMSEHGDLAHRLMAAYGKLRTDPCCSTAPGEAAFTRR
jgi:C4-dicarboxylate-binding protein DctP